VPAVGDATHEISQGPQSHDRKARSLDLDHLRQWIGKTQEASDIITAQLVKGLRATLFLRTSAIPKTGDAAP
jgi:3-methylfumaryl-CoA hydratase